jgi:alkylation response protein AidB-like acyl-CoA dehydrogenase
MERTTMDRHELRRADTSLDENQDAVRDAFAAFFAKECPTSVVRAAEPLGFDHAVWQRLVEMGVAAMSLPAALGGDDATLVDLVLIAEQSGQRLAPVPFASHVVATRLLGRIGRAGDVLEAAMAGQRVITLAHARAQTGIAQLVPDAAVAADVIALVDGALVLFSAPTPGKHVPNQGCTPLAWWEPDASSAVTLATGAAAAEAYDDALAEWKILTAAALVGLTEGALALGVEFARTRETMGVPIGSLQGVAFPLTDVAINIAGARNLTYKAAWIHDHEPGARPELALMAFDTARNTATSGTIIAAHVQGGLGFTIEADASLYFMRAKGWSAVAGDPAADLVRIGAGLVAGVHSASAPPSAPEA